MLLSAKKLSATKVADIFDKQFDKQIQPFLLTNTSKRVIMRDGKTIRTLSLKGFLDIMWFSYGA